MIGSAETGSGKTFAYTLPLIIHLRHRMTEESKEPGRGIDDDDDDVDVDDEWTGPIGLILVPTRELVEQIFQELEKFTNPFRNSYGKG